MCSILYLFIVNSRLSAFISVNIELFKVWLDTSGMLYVIFLIVWKYSSAVAFIVEIFVL